MNNHSQQKKYAQEFLTAVQRRLPSRERPLQEAFTSDHKHSVFVKPSEVCADTFYRCDDTTAQAFSNAVVDMAERHHLAPLTVGYPFAAEARGQQRHLQHLASQLGGIRVLAATAPPRSTGSLAYCNTKGTVLSRYRIALAAGPCPILFLSRDMRLVSTVRGLRHLGFFTFDAETIAGIAEDVDHVLRDATARMAIFDELEALHHTTQQIERELTSYSERLERAIRLARRQPNTLTPARYERLVNHAVAKMEQLKKLPLQALISLHKPSE